MTILILSLELLPTIFTPIWCRFETWLYLGYVSDINHGALFISNKIGSCSQINSKRKSNVSSVGLSIVKKWFPCVDRNPCWDQTNRFCFTRSFFFVRFSYLLGCKCRSYSILAYPNFCNDPLYFSTPTPPCLWLGVLRPVAFCFWTLLRFFVIADSLYLVFWFWGSCGAFFFSWTSFLIGDQLKRCLIESNKLESLKTYTYNHPPASWGLFIPYLLLVLL